MSYWGRINITPFRIKRRSRRSGLLMQLAIHHGSRTDFNSKKRSCIKRYASWRKHTTYGSNWWIVNISIIRFRGNLISETRQKKRSECSWKRLLRRSWSMKKRFIKSNIIINPIIITWERWVIHTKEKASDLLSAAEERLLFAYYLWLDCRYMPMS